MHLRNASPGDADALADFDLGDDSTPWLAEVREIVNGLLGWRDDPEALNEDRCVQESQPADVAPYVQFFLRL